MLNMQQNVEKKGKQKYLFKEYQWKWQKHQTMHINAPQMKFNNHYKMGPKYN